MQGGVGGPGHTVGYSPKAKLPCNDQSPLSNDNPRQIIAQKVIQFGAPVNTSHSPEPTTSVQADSNPQHHTLTSGGGMSMRKANGSTVM
jgi:hypothetical protein